VDTVRKALFWHLAVVGVTISFATDAHAQSEIRSQYTATPPKIEGQISSAEWQPAQRIEVQARGGSARCEFMLMNDEEFLYVGVSAVDDTTNTTSASTLTSGFDNMAIWFRGDVGYWVYGNGRLRTDKIDASSRTFSRFASRSKAAVVGPPSAPHMMYQLRIPLAEIGVSAGDSVAIGLHYWDNYDQGPSCWWPANVGVYAPARYGVMQTSRRP